MTFDARAFRNTLGRFPTGVTVVTTMTRDGTPAGVTVNSFASVSIAPPLILFCLGRSSEVFVAFSEANGFVVNFLSEAQRDLSERFAAPSAIERWVGINWHPAASGLPRFDGCLAHLDCTTETIHDGGDHIILIGRVRDLDWSATGTPLVYFRGRYVQLAADH